MSIFVEVPRKRLAELERIERAHSAYLGAMRRMRERVDRTTLTLSEQGDDISTGFVLALATFAEYIVEEGRNAS